MPQGRGGDSGCRTDSCGGCATCAGQGESQVPSLDNPYAYWLNHAGPVKINPSIGNAVLRLATPNTGPFDPGPCLAYNSKSTNSDNFGYGWGSRSRRWVEEIDSSTAEVHHGSGQVLRYTSYDIVTGYYTNPLGQATTFSYSGTTTEVQNARGNVYTLVFNSGGNLTKLVDALGRATTYTWSDNWLTKVQDPLGRVTTLTYRSSAHAGQRLSGLVDSLGHRHTYVSVTSLPVFSGRVCWRF